MVKWLVNCKMTYQDLNNQLPWESHSQENFLQWLTLHCSCHHHWICDLIKWIIVLFVSFHSDLLIISCISLTLWFTIIVYNKLFLLFKILFIFLVHYSFSTHVFHVITLDFFEYFFNLPSCLLEDPINCSNWLKNPLWEVILFLPNK